MHTASLSHLAPQLSRALQTVRPSGHADEGFVVVSVPAPLAPAERVFAAGDSGQSFFWAPARSMHFTAEGVAAEVSAAGPERFRDMRRLIGELLSSVKALEPQAPMPRVFGGFAFQDMPPQGSLWKGFEAARFVLPRTCYARTDERAWISLSVGHRELSDPPLVERLITRSVAWLEGLLAQPTPEDPRQAASERVSEVPERDGWGTLVGAIKREIEGGGFRKIVAARRAVYQLTPAPSADRILERLAQISGDCTRFAVRRDGKLFLGATPEWLVRKHGRELETEAVAGSRSSREPGAAALLEASAKDRVEHALVVEALLRALGPLTTELEAPPKPGIRVLRDILHLYTPVSATLREDTHVLDLVERLHPTPAVGGTPPAKAHRWIAEHESEERGWYASPLGWVDANGDGQFVVTLRSALLTSDLAHVFAGAGIVAESDADLEFEETELKLSAMVNALGAS